MPHKPIDLQLPGTKAFAAYDGPELVLYVVHDRTSPEEIYKLRQILNKRIVDGDEFNTYRLKAENKPEADWA